MISDWLAYRKCLFPGESLMKINDLELDKIRDKMFIPKTKE